LRSIDVAAVPDTEHDDFSPVVVDAVEDAIGAASGAPDALQLVAERRAYPSRFVEQWAGGGSMTANVTAWGSVSRIARAAGAVTTISYRDSVTGAEAL
jgi:hypothetical protein